MRATKARRFRDLCAGLGAIVAVMSTVATVVWASLDSIEAASANVAEASQELAWADTVSDAVNDEANAIDGLVATGDSHFIAPWAQGRARLGAAFVHLTAFTNDDPVIQRRDVALARQEVMLWERSFAEPRIAAANAHRRMPADMATGVRLVDSVQSHLEDLRTGEHRLLQNRDVVLAESYRVSRLALATGVALALATMLLILARSYGQFTRETALAQTEACKLKQALADAEAAQHAKTRFLANMSHEMRTPLNGVAGMAQALARTDLDRAQREQVEAITFSAALLDHLIGDLLSLTRDGVSVRQDRLRSRFNLGAATRAIAAPFAAAAEAKGVAVRIDGGDVDVDVSADAGALAELLACLLSNAVKFTERGEVRLGARALGDGRFAFEVADTGRGFDAATKARIFEAFAQCDDSDTRPQGGAGLGLAVAKRLAGEFGGALTAQSEPGVGSRFCVEVSLALAEPAATAPEPEAEAGCRVLVVDDNEVNRRVLGAILDQVGLEWLAAVDGREAVDAARREAFAAILMDIQMPVMDGLTATREIRRLERELGRPATPVIVVSANCQPEHIAAGAAAGAQRHLAKPVSVQALLGALNDVLAEETAAAA
ncbi:MAG TPA: response regulator [Caulobacteraceae bacterium]|jgi:signal transduction histidine kinase/ActR/RegA family two-component response regulator